MLLHRAGKLGPTTRTTTGMSATITVANRTLLLKITVLALEPSCTQITPRSDETKSKGEEERNIEHTITHTHKHMQNQCRDECIFETKLHVEIMIIMIGTMTIMSMSPSMSDMKNVVDHDWMSVQQLSTGGVEHLWLFPADAIENMNMTKMIENGSQCQLLKTVIVSPVLRHTKTLTLLTGIQALHALHEPAL
jgi:hypothetical protein